MELAAAKNPIKKGKFMSIKNSEKKEKQSAKNVITKMTKNATSATGRLMVNAVYTVIFVTAMILVGAVMTHVAAIVSGIMIGYYNLSMTMGTDVGAYMMFFILIIMICGLDLFFTFKLENALIRSLKKRLKHKPGKDEAELDETADMQDSKVTNIKSAKNKR